MPREIVGVLPVLHTPFLDDDSIDYVSLSREIDWAMNLGAHGVCVAMVSEILRLTSDERHELYDRVVELTAGRGCVVLSVGAESAKQASVYARAARQAGCDAIMAIPPISSALPEQSSWSYFTQLADQIDLPLIVQDASSYVGHALPVSFYVRLLEAYGPEKVLFKPEAAPLGPNISALRDATDGRARIFDGSGGILLIDAFRRGIHGTMPGCDLLDGIVALWRALQAGDEAAMYRLYYPICAIVALQLQAGLDGFLAIEKHVLTKRGIFARAHRRMPYGWTLDLETETEVDRLFDQLTKALYE